MKKARLGVIGLGPRGRYLARLYAAHPLCEVVALCDRFRPIAESAAAEIGLSSVKLFTDYRQMLKSVPLDAILIAAPPDRQVEMACHAMRLGLHVATEVPAAYTIDQCWQLVRTVEATGAKYLLAEQTRYWGFVRQWSELAAAGKLGKILFAEGEYMHYEHWDYYIDEETGERLYGHVLPPSDRLAEATWRNTGFLHPIYYLPHTLSPLLSIIGGRVVKVSCMGTRPAGYHVEGAAVRDMEVAIMHTSDDTVLRVACSFTAPSGPRLGTGYHWYQVKGTKGAVEWARSKGDTPRMWLEGDEDWRAMNWRVEPQHSPDFIAGTMHGNTDGIPVDNFLRAVVLNEPLGMDVYDAVETAAPAIIAAESSRDGGVLKEVPNFRKRG